MRAILHCIAEVAKVILLAVLSCLYQLLSSTEAICWQLEIEWERKNKDDGANVEPAPGTLRRCFAFCFFTLRLVWNVVMRAISLVSFLFNQLPDTGTQLPSWVPKAVQYFASHDGPCADFNHN